MREHKILDVKVLIKIKFYIVYIFELCRIKEKEQHYEKKSSFYFMFNMWL